MRMTDGGRARGVGQIWPIGGPSRLIAEPHNGVRRIVGTDFNRGTLRVSIHPRRPLPGTARGGNLHDSRLQDAADLHRA